MIKTEEKGITLSSLVITIIVLLILTSIGTTSGITITKSANFAKFKNELKMMQTKVNELSEEENYEFGEEITAQGQIDFISPDAINSIAKIIYSETESNPSDIQESFRFMSAEEIQTKWGLEVRGDYLISIKYRYVIFYEGFEHKGKTYYMIDQLNNGAYNVRYNRADTDVKNFNVTTSYEVNKWKINIDVNYGGNINSWTVKYKRAEETTWKTSDSLTFYITKPGKYTFNVVHGNEVNLGTKEETIGKDIKVGDIVSYTPESKTFTWSNDYCNSATNTDKGTILDNTIDGFKITEWIVSAYDEDTGEVELMSAEPTIGRVFLGGAQGYNNGVKLLNDACSTLYGNSSKGIIARSIKIEDIEERMTDAALSEAYNYINAAKYEEQVGTEYSSSNSYYPTIYAEEKDSVINNSRNEKGLRMSEQSLYITKTQNDATDGRKQATSIRPIQTCWTLNNVFMQTAFKGEGTGEENVNYQVIMPKGASTTYWVASRCVETYSSYCFFYIRYINAGNVIANFIYLSGNRNSNGNLAIRPVVSLNSMLMESSTVEGVDWEIKN